MKNKEFLIFSQNLRILKAKHKLTQNEMARICNICVNSMGRLLRNELPPKASVEILFRLAKHFNIEIKDLFSSDFK